MAEARIGAENRGSAEARWRNTNVTPRDVDALAEKGLLWLRGNTSRWEVHYAFFARNFGQMEAALDVESVHLFSPADVISAH